MPDITKICTVSGTAFVITEEDQAFYSKMGVPLPTLCPSDRQRRRLSFRNERHLYLRKCDLCHKEIVAMYQSESPYTVYCQTCWWSDQWDAQSYGQSFDFSRPFFEQFAQLMKKVPRISLMNKDHDNVEYGNFTLRNKNSYLLTTSAECEDSFYTKRSWNCRSVSDCSNLSQCELCYETLDSINCYQCRWLQNSADCSDCTLGYNLRNCKNCFGCFNLNNQSYCIYNVPYSPEDYFKKVSELNQNLSEEVQKFFSRTDIPRKYMDSANTENCSGDAVYNSKNAQYCFDVSRLEDCKFVFDATRTKDSYDMNNGDNSELLYECIGNEENYMLRFSDICWFDQFCTYCSLCFNSQNLFGCVGVKKGQYMILNKPYSKEEYEALVSQIIEHMQKTGEWGEFFPMRLSPFAYNETIAQDYYPLNEATCVQLGLRWRPEEEEISYQGPKQSPPLWASQATPETSRLIYTCIASGKLYKITPQELKLYQAMDLPLPQKCPEQRYKERMARKNPRALWQRPCDGCQKILETVYPPNRPEKIYCEKCYLEVRY